MSACRCKYAEHLQVQRHLWRETSSASCVRVLGPAHIHAEEPALQKTSQPTNIIF